MKIRRNDQQDIEMDMSPMIDMVFLLLIFFIVASQIVKVEKEPINLPQSRSAAIPEDETDRYMITVNQDGEVFAGLAQDQVTLEQLKERVFNQLEINEKMRFLIRADGQTKYEENEKVMNACAEAGAQDMIFAAFEKKVM